VQILILLFLSISPPENLLSQQKGIIYFVDSTKLEFNRIKTGKLNYEGPENYISEEDYFSLEEFQEINFQFEKQPTNADFSYLLKIVVFAPENKRYRIRLYNWDWLEMKTQSSHEDQNKKIILFHSNIKYPIDKIVFD
jgi:hypothetical protein